MAAKRKKKEVVEDPTNELGSMDKTNSQPSFNEYPWEIQLDFVEEPIVRYVKKEGISHIITSFIDDENLLKMCCELMYEINPRYLSNVVLFDKSISSGNIVNGYFIRKLAFAHIGIVGILEDILRNRDIKRDPQITLRASLWEAVTRVIAHELVHGDGIIADEGEYGAENMAKELVEKMIIQGKCCQMFSPEGPVEKMIQILITDVEKSIYAEEAKILITAEKYSNTCLVYSATSGKELALENNFRLFYKNKNGLKGGDWDKEPQAPEKSLKFTRPDEPSTVPVSTPVTAITPTAPTTPTATPITTPLANTENIGPVKIYEIITKYIYQNCGWQGGNNFTNPEYANIQDWSWTLQYGVQIAKHSNRVWRKTGDQFGNLTLSLSMIIAGNTYDINISPAQPSTTTKYGRMVADGGWACHLRTGYTYSKENKLFGCMFREPGTNPEVTGSLKYIEFNFDNNGSSSSSSSSNGMAEQKSANQWYVNDNEDIAA
jgi:uncharacterized membrane protein